ncbi:hypothetical protein D1Q00_gp051 [Trichoplusia ni granulovirus LBIV-12]|uniref:Uncharacterized protein n=1 Tax=Trichoplusia ni granulovirus LBIV-12 TaxID=1916701 RepID=A0A1D8QL70_GVTN|nr:hypothetical protein D1Q00_gp051 [Trichoplusia ni granulovirus LBIV-12]AOW41390.1 hypothetical protein [Trichoplusia ni granulovirus LBIV-12]
MYYKAFILLFCINVITESCAEIKSDRVKNLIEEYIKTKLKSNRFKLPRPNPPSYLDIQEFSPPGNNYISLLTRHHLVSGSQLNTLYTTLLENSPETLIQIFRSIFFNLPPAWRDDIKNVEYLQAIWCLDETVADEALENVDKCNEAMENLHTLFYWRPDNIQIGPTLRFRDGGDGYDYDCFYLLRGAEMIYNMEFRTAVEAVIDADYTVTEEEHTRLLQGNFNRLLRASHNMITNRNVPRNYNPNEWIEIDKFVCCRHHQYMFRKELNQLEKTFDLKQQQSQAFVNAQQSLTTQSMTRLVAWTRSALQSYEGDRKQELQTLADRIRYERNEEKFTELVLDFIQISPTLLNVEEFMDVMSLHTGDGAIMASRMSADFMLQLYTHHVSDEISREEIENVLDKRKKNRKLMSILNILRAGKGKESAAQGYITYVENIVAYNTYFLSRYLGIYEFRENETKYLSKYVDTNNVTSTVKDFKEMRKKDDDDDDQERDANKNLLNWYTFMMSIYRFYEDSHCVSQLDESVKKIVNSKMCAYDDPTSGTLFDIMDKTRATDNISPDIKECSATMNIRGNTRIRAQRDVGDKSTREKQLQLSQLVEEVYQNINSTYQYDRATVLYQMVANRMHPLIKKSLNLVCHIPDDELVHAACQGYRYPGCYWDQPVLEKATIVMDKITCHGLNILSFGIGYFFIKC